MQSLPRAVIPWRLCASRIITSLNHLVVPDGSAVHQTHVLGLRGTRREHRHCLSPNAVAMTDPTLDNSGIDVTLCGPG